ncbi:MAG TPA: Ig-like domain-containing protein [Thermoplasmata archaeon]
MRTKLLIVLVVLGLVAVGLSAVDVARAIPLPHTVEGSVGPNPAPGLGNPSNPASAVYYLTNRNNETPQVKADIQDADGVNLATHGMDVGSGWTDPLTLEPIWKPGDEVVVVLETVRGNNGWNGPNWTTSSDGILTTLNVDTLPAANIEQIPTLALNKGPAWVDVTWTGLADGNGNVVNYTVYRAQSITGPWAMIGRSGPQVPSGPMSYNDTGRAQGTWCYKIAVDYRDTATTWYTTAGTSEGSCVAIGRAPFITSTNPIDTEANVVVTTSVVVVFSEAMNPGTVTWVIAPPGITFVASWDVPLTTLTLTHAVPFTQCQAYTMTITGRDADDNFPLDPAQGVPNPWTFTAFCPSPQITVTSPADGATGVRRTSDVVVTFSKAMNTGSVTVTGFTFDGSGWTVGNTVLTLTHTAAFAVGATYTITVAGQDTVGNPLIPGPVPNPWSFTANRPPAVAVSSPAAGLDWTGGSAHDIAWTMGPDETPTNQLVVWINYTSSSGNGVVASLLTSRPSPDVYTWNVPGTINAVNVVVCIDAADTAGDVGNACSAQFQVDSTRPTVVSATPTGTTVAGTANIVITFSEAMGRAATVAAITIAPAVTNTTGWTVGDTVLTISHATAFTVGTYTVTVGVGARDASAPGNTLATPHQWSFTVASPTPNPPSAVTFTSASATTIDVRWTAPTTYTDGSALSASDIKGYYIERSTSASGPWTNLTSTARAGTTFQDTNLAAGTTYYYHVQTVLVNDRVSAWTTPQSGATLVAPSDLTWLWILLIIIIVVIILAALLAWRRKKPAEAPATPEEAAPPEPETPSEPMEESAPEEGGEGGGST